MSARYTTLDLGLMHSGMLSADAHELITNPETELVFSAISIWQVAIKYALGRKEFDADPSVLRRGLKANGYSELDFTSEHALAVAALPLIHKDPRPGPGGSSDE